MMAETATTSAYAASPPALDAPAVGNSTSKEETALDHARAGSPVFPCYEINEAGVCACWRGANCFQPGKHPRTLHGFKDATTDLNQIRMWWRQWPHANPATPTGAKSNIIVLDVDPRNGGLDSLKRLTEKRGSLKPERLVRTGGGGWHAYFSYPGYRVKSRSDAFGPEYPGLDIKGDGGYVLLPTSNHASGGEYREIRDGEPAPAPEWLLKHIGDDRDQHVDRRDVALFKQKATVEVNTIPKGERNITLTSIAGRLHDGRPFDDLLKKMLTVNTTRCASPLPEAEVEKIAHSIYRLEPCRRSSSSSSPTPEVIGNLKAILDRFWRDDFKGRGGDSERDLELAIILLALSSGHILPSGNVAVPDAGFRKVAEMARIGEGTAHRALGRLRSRDRVLGGANGPNRKLNEPAGFVLVAPREVEHPLTTSSLSTNRVEGVPVCAPPSSRRGRHSAPGLKRVATKKMIKIVDHLDHAGGTLCDEDLAKRMGIARVRDLRRRYLKTGEEEGVVECSPDGAVSLATGWQEARDRMFERDEEHERALYGGLTTDERQKERHRRERDAYHNRDQVVPDKAPAPGETRELLENRPERRRREIELGISRLFRERPEFRARRVGQVTCALPDYLPPDFPRGFGGLPKDSEVATVLNGEPVVRQPELCRKGDVGGC